MAEVDTWSAAAPRTAAEPRHDGSAESSALNGEEKMQGNTVNEKKRKNALEEPRKADGKKTRTSASSASPVAPIAQVSLSAASVAAVPAALVMVAPAAAVVTAPAAAVTAVPAALVTAVRTIPAAYMPASVFAAVPAIPVAASPTSPTKIRHTEWGIFKITEGAQQTYITCQARDSEKRRLVIALTQNESEFHNGIGWELFEKLVSGEVEGAEWRPGLWVKYRHLPNDD